VTYNCRVIAFRRVELALFEEHVPALHPGLQSRIMKPSALCNLQSEAKLD
jgi:hypothetical protein